MFNGPLAAVYQAYDTIHGIRVALKVANPAAMDEFFLADFKREARLAPKLEHPNILPIRDASFIEGLFVISMPLGECSLADRMRRRIATATALDFADQALAGVAHAHHNKIIHCDIKPDNFIVFSGNQLKLGDFAFSKVAIRTLKASGSGTIGYMAPEQALGRPMFQSDVFSLGLLIYELFSGHLHEWPYEWPPAHIQRVREKLKPSLVEWLRKSTQIRPADRYKDAVSMYREFKRLRNGSARRRPSARRQVSTDPALWESVRFRQFQRKYRKALDTRFECRHCEGPVSESMQCCPWCGTAPPLVRFETTYPASCPRCHRGTKLDWPYCAWCYGFAFEVETNRRYPDRRYETHCTNANCRGPLMPFMRYCPWCRTKVKRAWKLRGGEHRCPSCRWGVDLDFWRYCAWCTKVLRR
jgi:serine/threonine-protein kinase